MVPGDFDEALALARETPAALADPDHGGLAMALFAATGGQVGEVGGAHGQGSDHIGKATGLDQRIDFRGNVQYAQGGGCLSVLR